MANTIRNCLSLLLAGALTVTSAGPALAATQVSDLDGMRAGSLDAEMEGRGFTLHHNAASGQGVYTYWWKPADKTCARVYTSDGRVAGTRLVSVADCGQKSGDSGAAAAVAAAALIGALALASKSHHRNDQHEDNPRQLADFDRGHRDGLYNQAYHNYGNSEPYRQGYESGVREREEQSRHRAGRGGRGGYARHVELSDLTWQDRPWALQQLDQRGFRRVGDYQMGAGQGHSFTYYNQQTHQCVHLTTRAGKVQMLEAINEGNCQ